MVRVGFQARSAEGARLDDEVVALDPRATPGAGELGDDLAEVCCRGQASRSVSWARS